MIVLRDKMAKGPGKNNCMRGKRELRRRSRWKASETNTARRGKVVVSSQEERWGEVKEEKPSRL